MRSNGIVPLAVAVVLGLAGCSGTSDDGTSRGDGAKASAERQGDSAQQPSPQDSHGTVATAAPTPPKPDEANGNFGSDLTYVVPEFFMALIVHPQRITQAPVLADLPQDDFLRPLLEAADYDPRKVHRLMFLYTPRVFYAPGLGDRRALVIRSAVPLYVKGRVEGLWEEVNEVVVAGKPCWATPLPDGRVLAAHFADDQNTVLAPTGLMEKVLKPGRKKGLLADRLDGMRLGDVTVVAVLDPIRDELKGMLGFADRDPSVPPPVLQMIRALDDLSAAVLTVDLRGNTLARIDLYAKDATGAGRLAVAAEQNVALAKQMFTQNRQRLSEQMPPKLAGSILGLAEQTLEGISVRRDAERVTLSVIRPDGLDEAVKTLAPVLVNDPQLPRAEWP